VQLTTYLRRPVCRPIVQCVMFTVVRKKKSIWRRLLESKPHEYRSIKILFMFPLGLFVGIGITQNCYVYLRLIMCVLLLQFCIHEQNKLSFLLCISTLTHGIDIAILFVHLSVCHVPVFCGNGLTYCRTSFTTRYSPIILVF